MTLRHVRLFALLPLLLAAQVLGAEVATKERNHQRNDCRGGKADCGCGGLVEGISAETAKAQISAGKPKKAVIDQREMKFVPHVLPVLVGTTVEFPNHDTAWHNVYSKGGAKDFDLGLYPPGKTGSTTFDKPGVARILCNAHPNMEAFIVVKEHPFFSSANKGGNYRLDGVPLGKHRIQIGIRSSARLKRESNWFVRERWWTLVSI